MAKYKLTNTDIVLCPDEGLSIPPNSGWRWEQYEEWLAEGNTPDPADPEPIVYNISPSQNNAVVGSDVVISVNSEPSVQVTLYVYSSVQSPTIGDEYDVSIDENGKGSVTFTPQNAGEYAIRGKSGALAAIVAIIKVVG